MKDGEVNKKKKRQKVFQIKWARSLDTAPEGSAGWKKATVFIENWRLICSGNEGLYWFIFLDPFFPPFSSRNRFNHLLHRQKSKSRLNGRFNIREKNFAVTDLSSLSACAPTVAMGHKPYNRVSIVAVRCRRHHCKGPPASTKSSQNTLVPLISPHPSRGLNSTIALSRRSSARLITAFDEQWPRCRDANQILWANWGFFISSSIRRICRGRGSKKRQDKKS